MNKLSMINCPHFNLCSGCSLNCSLDLLPQFQEAQIFFKSYGYSLPLLRHGTSTEWRLRAKLAVRGTIDEPRIGLYKENSHEVIDIPFCKVHHPKINEAVEIVKDFIREEKIQPYDEEKFEGILRYLQLGVERKSQKVQLTLVLNQECRSIPVLWNRFPHFWHSIWVNQNQRKDNAIFGEKWDLLFGEKYLWENLAGIEIPFLPSSFMQVNLAIFEEMIIDLRRFVSRGTSLVEYYAGVGVLGLALAKECKKVICCEINKNSLECFEGSKKKMGLDNISFVVGEAGKLLELLDQGDTILVDPPRKGLDGRLLKALSQIQTSKKLIYISCGWESFQKDFSLLQKEGWRLEHAQAYLFFPGTNQIELLAVLKKSSG